MKPSMFVVMCQQQVTPPFIGRPSPQMSVCHTFYTVGHYFSHLCPPRTCMSLHCSCEVFRAMFADSSVADGSPLVLSDVKPIIFMAVLEYVYTNCCSLSTPSVSVECVWWVGAVGVSSCPTSVRGSCMHVRMYVCMYVGECIVHQLNF